ncbi:transporter [Aliidongia dinghuensis]|uniref:Transporter n=1 Tax=Aliidongia dinghuensis TaxID=1867774 RepID=A0A8J2YRC6_9PROT|nr:DMT family transporter [Aliidongia dinghuensis]GGF08281.1 transporter [Aliidongia dinghuensis]
MDHALSRRTAVCLFTLVVVAWGLNWLVTKAIVQSVVPLWATAIRTAIATVALFGLQLARGQLVLPRRGDLPVIIAIAGLHMVAFSTLVAFGLRFAPVGRSVVLGYTTPIWVAPGAWLFLGEAMTKRRLAGIGVSLAGLAVLFNPLAFDWHDRGAWAGDGLILLAALCWAANILYVRAHKWLSTPFQLIPWQTLLATTVLTTVAFAIDGPPQIRWNPALASAFLYSGVCGSALAYWAMAVVNRSLPAVTTSLGLLMTPVVGLLGSAVGLGEPVDVALVLALALILTGIALGTLPRRASGAAPCAAPSAASSVRP